MENENRRWDGRDIRDLAARYMAGADVQTLAGEFGRSVAAIKAAIHRYGLARQKATAADRAKLDCMPDPFRRMGGKDHLTTMNKPDTRPGYSADIDTEYDRVTENGTKVCGSCGCFKYEDVYGYGECGHHDVPESYFEARHCSDHCGNWTPKTK